MPAGPPSTHEPNGTPYDKYKELEAQMARRVWTPAERIAQWRKDGPLVHEPTGITTLDELTGGGPVYGTRWYLLGAPDAGKTALLVQIADEWKRRDIEVGVLAVDEEADDWTTRLAQRAKFTRRECEERSKETLDELEAVMANLGIRLYGPEWTIEAAAHDLAIFAQQRPGKSERPNAALLVDSIQQVSSQATFAAERELSERQTVSANVRALRTVGTRYRMICIATSEMNRNAYRSIEAAEQSNDMAAGKESGAIEFSARVMLSLRSVKDHGELLQVRMVKSKHGPSHPAAADFFLTLDRTRQTLTDADGPQDEQDAKAAAKVNAQKAEHVRAAARVAEYLAAHPGKGTRDIQSDLRRSLGSCRDKLGTDAVALLDDAGAIVAPEVKRGQARPHWLVGSKVPAEVLAQVDMGQRPAVSAAKPPAEAK
jgi:nucleoside-triphosphatase THEP1